MVIRHTLLIAGLWSVTALAQADEVTSLSRARAALDRGDRDAAAAAYAEIGSDHPDWANRLGDTWRWHFLHGAPLEAWRVVELAQRTNVPLEQGDYARMLTLLKNKVCTLGLTAQESLAIRLAHAHVYRFPGRFRSVAYDDQVFAKASAGAIPRHLGMEQHHYLADIPNAKLIAGNGCQLAEGRLNDKKTAAAFELAHLQRWYLDPRHRQQPGYEPVELRVVQLAGLFKRQDLSSQILSHLTKLDVEGWLKLPEQERRFLWSHGVEAKLIPPPPYKSGSGEAKLIEAMILRTTTVDAATWMGLLDEATINSQRRFEIASHLLTIPDIPHRPFLLLRQAEGYAMRNEIPSALAVLRRLLVQQEGEDDQEVMAAASVLAGDLFAEFGYDEAILGAIQNTVPTGQWGRIFRRQLMLDALSGNSKSFDMLQKMTKTPAHSKSLRLSREEQDLLEAMAHRRQGAFRQVLTSFGKGKHQGSLDQTFFADLGANAVQLDPDQRRAVQDYLAAIGQTISEYARRNSYNKTLGELARLFLGESDDAYSKGSETARSGTVTVGVVSLATKTLVTWPFEWSPLTSLPLRELLLVPRDATSGAWVIQ